MTDPLNHKQPPSPGVSGADGAPDGQTESADHPASRSTVTATPGRHAVLPDRIGPYKILEVLDEGGMGVVYLAEQIEPIRRRVALKLVKLGMDTKSVIARFESERQALALMNHPNVAKVYDAGTTQTGRPYFVMEHVPGIPITDYCDKHTGSPRKSACGCSPTYATRCSTPIRRESSTGTSSHRMCWLPPGRAGAGCHGVASRRTGWHGVAPRRHAGCHGVAQRRHAWINKGVSPVSWRLRGLSVRSRRAPSRRSSTHFFTGVKSLSALWTSREFERPSQVIPAFVACPWRIEFVFDHRLQNDARDDEEPYRHQHCYERVRSQHGAAHDNWNRRRGQQILDYAEVLAPETDDTDRCAA